MHARYLGSMSGLLGLLLLAGPLSAAQPGSSTEHHTDTAPGSARLQVKPQAPVDVEYQIQSTPEAGQPLVIDLQFTTFGNGQAMDANFRSESGLDISDRGSLRRIIAEEGTISSSQSLTVIPRNNGLFHLTVFANVLVEGRLQSRVVAIPIQVGAKSANPDVATKKIAEVDINDNPIKSLPAKTTITEN